MLVELLFGVANRPSKSPTIHIYVPDDDDLIGNNVNVKANYLGRKSEEQVVVDVRNS